MWPFFALSKDGQPALGALSQGRPAGPPQLRPRRTHFSKHVGAGKEALPLPSLTGSRDKGVFPMQAVPLTRNNDFRRLYKRGKSLVDRNIVVYYAKNRLGANRVGFTVGKKVGGAVTRNRAKRLMRESFRLLEPGLAQGFDFVLVSRSRLPHLKRQAVDASLSRLLGSAGLLHKGESS